MGFYSIYKIIKDVIRTLFGNRILKLLIVVTIFVLCMFYLGERGVFASFTITNDINNQNFFINDTFINKYPYYCFCTTSDGSYIYVICSNSPITTNSTDSTSYAYYTYYNSSNTGMALIGGSYSFVQNSLNNSNFPNINTNVNQITTNSLGAMRVFYSNHPIKNNTSGDTIIDTFVPPSLGNSQQQLENLSFSNFIINANSYTDEIENNDGTLFMLFYNRSLSNSQTTDGLYPIKEKGFTKGSIYTDYNNSTSSNMVFSFPIFMSGVYFNIGSTYEIRFAKKSYNTEYNTYFYEYLGEPYTFTISSNVTQDYINQLNQQTATSTDNEDTQDLQNSIDNQTQSIDNINNTITDSNVDSSSINLPTDNTNDPTQSGVDNIFQTIYNSFTSGTAQDIVFPIPNTNKNITLPANYTYNALNSNNASWVINIIQAFYWYIISRYIIIDIMQKIRKIKQGNLDNIENSNIKEDML